MYYVLLCIYDKSAWCKKNLLLSKTYYLRAVTFIYFLNFRQYIHTYLHDYRISD